MQNPGYPTLYQVNTRVWMTELSSRLKRRAALDDITDAELDRFVAMGFDWVWFLSVWQTGKEGQRVSRTRPEWRKEFAETLPDLKEEDIAGSGFAITAYRVDASLGGDDALARLRDRLHQRGIKLMLDFVPNHMALDHPWLEDFPEYFVRGTKDDLARTPQNYFRIHRGNEELIFAHGRDPYFPGWPDTVQLNYGNPELQNAMIRELISISGQCDGVRCDMAMLVLPDVFERTWGFRPSPFWTEATRRVRHNHPGFLFMAEVYWDLEWTLQQQGFEYAYDKRLYDRLREGHAGPVRRHFYSGLDYQDKLARFLENHDEPRAAATFSTEVHQAAAMITFLAPGLRFFHQGQFEGRRKRISPHLVRAPQEAVSKELQQFYSKLLDVLKLPVLRKGAWQLLECTRAWEGNGSHDSYIAFAWSADNSDRVIVSVNYSPGRSQCFVKLPFEDLADQQWRLCDLIDDGVFERDGNDLKARGLFLDEPPWKAYAFLLTRKA